MKSRQLLWIPGTNFNCSRWAPINHLTLYYFLEVKNLIVWSENKSVLSRLLKKINFHVRNKMFKTEKLTM